MPNSNRRAFTVTTEGLGRVHYSHHHKAEQRYQHSTVINSCLGEGLGWKIRKNSLIIPLEEVNGHGMVSKM